MFVLVRVIKLNIGLGNVLKIENKKEFMKFLQIDDDCVIATAAIERLYIDECDPIFPGHDPTYVLRVQLNDFDEINYEISNDLKSLRDTLKDLCNKLNGAG